MNKVGWWIVQRDLRGGAWGTLGSGGVSESVERAQERAQNNENGWGRVRRGLAGGAWGIAGGVVYARACRDCSAKCLSGRNQGPTVQQQHQQQQPTRVANAAQPYGVSDSPFPFKWVCGPQ